ncbi:hypothetical protein [Halolamina salifodinae]|uniref:Uncharacterized protein n=1 Tax=Halolamina salifodinae TaxID=1202767 RepID=A0A8T4GU02_9EURY|nr:hypothetical protein [Halolamina salifodinae]MBP1986369.1 hypothetical protein [Halolamina salifodinae]
MDDGRVGQSVSRRGELSYRRTERESDCDGGEDVAATFVRVPARFEQVTRFGFGVS